MSFLKFTKGAIIDIDCKETIEGYFQGGRRPDSILVQLVVKIIKYAK